jgi:hypothetical protein
MMCFKMFQIFLFYLINSILMTIQLVVDPTEEEQTNQSVSNRIWRGSLLMSSILFTTIKVQGKEGS